MVRFRLKQAASLLRRRPECTRQINSIHNSLHHGCCAFHPKAGLLQFLGGGAVSVVHNQHIEEVAIAGGDSGNGGWADPWIASEFQQDPKRRHSR